MGLISPKEVNDDPKKWLSVVHELHPSLLPLMEKMFPGFKERKEKAGVYCLECHELDVPGKPLGPFSVLQKDGQWKTCTGLVRTGQPPPDDWLLRLV